MTKQEEFRNAYHSALATQIDARRAAAEAERVAAECARTCAVMGDAMNTWFAHTAEIMNDLRQKLDKKGGVE